MAFSGIDLVVHVSDVGGRVRIRQGRLGGAATMEVWSGFGLGLCFDMSQFPSFRPGFGFGFGPSSWCRFCVSILCGLFVCCLCSWC